MFQPGSMLSKYLSTQPYDMYDIVGALMGYINADPYFKTNEFEEAVSYVLAQGITEQELFDEFDDEIEYIGDSEKWDYDYYCYARVYLKDNFCRKRIEHVKQVAKKVQGEQCSIQSTTAQSVTHSRSIETRSRETSGKKTRDQRGMNSQGMTTQKNVIMSIICVIVVVILVILGVNIID